MSRIEMGGKSVVQLIWLWLLNDVTQIDYELRLDAQHLERRNDWKNTGTPKVERRPSKSPKPVARATAPLNLFPLILFQRASLSLSRHLVEQPYPAPHPTRSLTKHAVGRRQTLRKHIRNRWGRSQNTRTAQALRFVYTLFRCQ